MTTPYIGEIRMLPYNFAPLGWADCDGSLLDIASNEELFTLIGTTYGGDGQTTFALPDLRGRLPLHQGTGTGLSPYWIGDVGGSEIVTLLPTQMPDHNHAISATSADASSATPAASNQLGRVGNDVLYTNDITGIGSAALQPTMLAPAGGNEPHGNLMPTLTVRFCIATQGIFPVQG